MTTKTQKRFSTADLLALQETDIKNIWREGSSRIHVIQKHYRTCEECRCRFDALGYCNFKEFKRVLASTPISCWTCEGEDEGLIPSK